MKKIDTQIWGEFKVGDLFEIHPTRAYKLTNAQLLDGGPHPVVVNSAYNNGIGGYTSQEATEHGNMITFSDTVDASTIFYQEEDFVGYPHVQGLYPKGQYKNCWTKKRLQFFVAILKKAALSKGFDYGYKFRRDIAINIIVCLPMRNNTPDWEYMEQYMQSIEMRVNASVSALNALLGGGRQRHQINVSKWLKFRVGEILPIIVKPAVYHTKEVKEDVNGIPYVVRSKFDNGIKCRVQNNLPATNPAGVISFGAENATFFYQEKIWCSGRDIYYIDTRALSRNTCMFLIACLRQIAAKYSYNFGLFPDLVKKEILNLPVTSAGMPDWDYMDNYMQQMELCAKQILDKVA